VPEDKIIQRYHRTLDLLLPALRGSSKAYIFDNSEKEMKLIAKVKNGELTLLFPTEELPKWFLSAVINKLYF
jgi:predicted ABC-type ATPase